MQSQIEKQYLSYCSPVMIGTFLHSQLAKSPIGTIEKDAKFSATMNNKNANADPTKRPITTFESHGYASPPIFNATIRRVRHEMSSIIPVASKLLTADRRDRCCILGV